MARRQKQDRPVNVLRSQSRWKASLHGTLVRSALGNATRKRHLAYIRTPVNDDMPQTFEEQSTHNVERLMENSLHLAALTFICWHFPVGKSWYYS
jgi:hypothetical protein